jgi:hypothetical protein
MAEATKDIPVGHLGNLTPDQENALKAVKSIENLPARYDDLLLLRFLRARQFDAAKTTEMIKNDIEWRQKVGADSALETWPKNKWYKQCLDYWPSAFHGVDRYGNPAYFERLGNIDPKSFVGSISQEDLVQYHIWAMERIEAKMREGYNNGTVPAAHVDLGVLYVEDMGGFGMRHFNKAGLDMVRMLSAIDQDHYPEMLRKVIAINVPSLFSAVWKIVSPWLDPITQGKIDLLGSSGYMTALENEGLTPETIPTFVNGSKCTSCTGPCMPAGGVFGDLPDTCPVANVNAGANFEKSVKVEKPDSVLSYRFKVAEYNIGFSIALEEENGKRKELVAYNKFESEPVQGEFTAPVPGTYVFIWDNSFSMWRKKVVKYEVEVLEPSASSDQQ